MRRLLFVLGCLALSAAATDGRQQTPGPAFDVASVKENRSGRGGTLGFDARGGFRAIGTPLWRVIAEAYADAPAAYPYSRSLPRFRIEGGPSWIDDDRFDIEAKPEGVAGPGQQHLMLRALLAERFGLVARMETRPRPVYHLVKARADGRLGPGLRAADVDCAAVRAAGGAPPEAERPERRPCVMRFGRSLATAIGLTMADLAESVLSRYVGRVVHDRTGLAGPFEWTLEWTPDPLVPTVGGETPIDPNGPSLFAALREQLGLRLEPATGPVPVLVIERAERPTEN